MLAAAKSGLDAADYDHVHASIWCLKTLDLEEFDRALISTLNRLPIREQKKPDELLSDRIASFAQQAAHSSSPAVWSALLTATRRAEPDLRVSLVFTSVRAEFDKPRKLLLFTFLLPLLDDVQKGTGKWTNLISVQDQAARSASYILGIAVPGEDATPSDLASFRSKVKTAMEDAIAKGRPDLPSHQTDAIR